MTSISLVINLEQFEKPEQCEPAKPSASVGRAVFSAQTGAHVVAVSHFADLSISAVSARIRRKLTARGNEERNSPVP